MISCANVKQLDVDKLVLRHVQVNKAQNGRRRTYRAHGRVTPYMSNPAHVELWAEIDPTNVAKPDQKTGKVVSVKRLAKRRRFRELKVGE